MSITSPKALTCLISACLLFSQSALSAERLDKIKSTQTINIGYDPDKFPNTYHNQSQQAIGFDMELMQYIKEHIAKETGIANLQLNPVAINDTVRFDKLAAGDIDLSCSGHSNIAERKQRMNFSSNYFQARVRLMTLKSSDIHSYKELAGKKVGVIVGTFGQEYIETKGKQYKIKETIKVNERHELIKLLQDGAIDAILDDDILTIGASALQNSHENTHFIGPAISIDNYACILPKEDTELKELVDKALNDLFYSGKINDIYQKWFLSPIPTPNGSEVNLSFEMGTGTKLLYTNPSDKSIGE